MSGKCLLTLLPLALTTHILEEWSNLKSLKAFDTACCNRSIRRELREIIQSEELHLYQKVLAADLLTFRSLGKDTSKSASSRLIILHGKSGENIGTYLARFGDRVQYLLATPRSGSDYDAVCRSVVTYCTNIVSVRFNVSSCILLYRILESNQNIEELFLWRELVGQPDRDPLQIVLPRLRTLECKSDDYIEDFVRMGSRISRLDISDCGIVVEHLECISPLFPHLRALSLASTAVSDETLLRIARECPQLRHLNLRKCCGITDEGVGHVAKNMTELASLNIENCANLTNQSLVYIYTHCAHTLRTLHLNLHFDPHEEENSGPVYDNTVLNKLFDTCQNIRTLHWSEYRPGYATYTLSSSIRNVTTLALDANAQNDANLAVVATNCAHLANLSLTFYGTPDEVSNTHEGLKNIMYGCPQLLILNMFDDWEALVHPFTDVTFNKWKELRPKLIIHENNEDIPCFSFDVLRMTE